MIVQNVMSTDVEVININETIDKAARMMRDGDFGSIPVESNERLQGMITDRDITIRVVAESRDPREVKVGDCMSSGIEYCFEDEDVEDLAEKMAKTRYRRFPVLNRDKRLVGIVSLGDIARGEDSESITQQVYQEIATH